MPVLDLPKTRAALTRGFQSSSFCTPEFNSFYWMFRAEFSNWLKRHGCSLVKTRRGHFEVSGFFMAPTGEPNGFRMFYFNTSDVRGMCQSLGMYYRTAKDLTDYTGGENRIVKLMGEFPPTMSFGPDRTGHPSNLKVS